MIIRVIAVLLLAVGTALAQRTPEEKHEPGVTEEANEDSIELKEVRESSAKDVGEALQSIAGISKVRKGGIANDVVLRGFQQDNINVQIDGARVYGACPNNMDPSVSHVDFAEVDRVEVIKGPFDVERQGSLGGTVKIITRSEEVTGVRLVPAFAYGAFGYYNPSLELSVAKSPASFTLGYAYRTSDPYEDGSGRRFTSYGNFRADIIDTRAFEGHSGWGSLAFSPAKNHQLNIGYSRQQNGLTLYPYLLMDAVYDNADRATIKYAIRNSSSFIRNLQVEGFATKVNHLMNDAHRTSSGSMTFGMATHAVTSGVGVNAAIELPLEITIGVESNRRTWDAVTLMRSGMNERLQNSLPDVVGNAIGIFGEVDREIGPHVRVLGGLRFDHASSATSTSTLSSLYFAYNNTRARGASDNFGGGNARVHLMLSRNLSLFAGVGSTARIPDPQERYFALQRMAQDWVGNPALSPSRNTESDFGLTVRSGRVTARALIFYSDLTDYIVLRRQIRRSSEPGVPNNISQSYANVDARIYGGEGNLLVIFGKLLAISGGASFARGSKDVSPAISIFNSNLAEMPPAKSWANVRYAKHWLYLQLGAVAVAAQRRVDRDLNEQSTPGYGVLNTKIGFFRSGLSINVGIDNLLNRFYYESFSYSRDPFRSGLKVPEPGRSVFVSASYRF